MGLFSTAASAATSFVPGLNWLKIAKVVVPLLVLAAVFFWLRGVFNERAELRAWQGDMVSAVRAEMPVARRDKVDSRSAIGDVQWLGREYRTHAEALRVQSEKLVAAKANATAAQNEAAEARKRAVERNRQREGIRRAILAPDRSTGLTEVEWGAL